MRNLSSSMVIAISAAAFVGARDSALRAEHLNLLQHNANLQKKSSESEEAAQTKTWAETTLSTMHGCECAENWHDDGLVLHGCVYTEGHDLPWCFVKDADACKRGYGKTVLLIGGDKFATGICNNATGCEATFEQRDGKWDFCALAEEVDTHFTHNGCHCLPTWEFDKNLYSGCSQTNGDYGKSWCPVAEANCAGAQAWSSHQAGDATIKQKWDSCDIPSDPPAFVTRHSCHCKPNWSHDGKKQSSCVANKLLKPPEVLAAINVTLEKESLYGWCHVFEDERGCSGAVQVDGHHMDVCFLVDDADVQELETTLHSCHCLPEWSLDGIVYKGCSKTTGVGDEATWCHVIEDESVCADSLGPEHATAGGAGRGPGRWDWCRPNGKPQDWRLPDERFTPKEPDLPSWYQEFRIDQAAGKSDLDY